MSETFVPKSDFLRIILERGYMHQCSDLAGLDEKAARGEGPMFQLVVSDIKMPDRNGYEVFAAARRIKPDLPVILMTGFGYDPHHSIVRASQEGLQDVLYKPFQVEQLVELVRKALKFGGRDGITAAS